ncbi:MAG TPA: histidine kinase dimerization/phospho-acceptor domain-containing protein, partial [Candidatus Acidoferrales bacterium]|nr:histidine kinase dimerization/phospho-acceptor domain-containing protein [Candidatus Acidoferrales bacterium]
MSVRFSQVLVAIVLALVAYALFRTVSAYQETTAIADLRAHGGQIVERETERLGERVAAVESLAALTAMEGYVAPHFERDARRAMGTDDAVMAVDFFNANDEHTAHIEAGRAAQRGVPMHGLTRSISHPEIQALEIALFDAELSRATSVSDMPPKQGSASNTSSGDGLFYLATRVVWHDRDVGTIVEFLDVRRLATNDIASVARGPFILDDGRGHLLAAVGMGSGTSVTARQNFAIPFADRVMQLTLIAPARAEVKAWWFALGWIALVLAIVLPMEIVGHINRRVQALNEELESRVAARTRQLEESLEESRRLGVVVESVREGVMRVDADGVIRYVNAALCTELQRGPYELLGKHAATIHGLGLAEGQLAEIRDEVSESGFVYREMERTRADGSPYVAGVTFTRHGLDGAGGLIAVSRDVTARRRLIDELLEANDLIERQMRARADFIATASHELRTPVTTLRMLAALLLEKLGPRDGLAADDARLLGVLDQETRRLARLVDDLLKIARLDAPGVSVAMGQVDLRAMVESIVEETARFGDGPTLELHADAGRALVYGDPEALRSVAQNLIGNARKFTPATGHVAVTLETTKDRVRFVVADSGIGISKDDLP